MSLSKANKNVLILFTLLLCSTLQAQLSNLARLEYSFIPKKNSEDTYSRFRGFFNIPIEISEDDYLVFGAEYNNVAIDLEDHYPFNRSLINQVHIIDATIGYTFKHNEKWRFGAKVTPRIASTLKSKITGSDFFINGGVYAINDKTKDETAKKPNRLIIGLTYNSTSGLPFPLPFVSYFRKLNSHWAYTLGVPKANIEYYFNEKNVLQSFISLDGYYAHVQDKITVNNQVVENVSLRVIVLGLGYEYYFTKHFAFYMYSGYTLDQKNILRNKDKDKVFTLDDVNTLYLRTGLKYKI
ncbi:DUF6268 family outer membrane beta-barrel protein [Corallibacter sp.]|uniref:DUF6268 family outer membrane beta-barrel protein n=1 Tax=Corallibacter sp. TaxID=2038084 RepID=UPI003A91F22B